MDKDIWGAKRWGKFRWGVHDPVHDRLMDQLKKQPACHLGNCAPAVFGPGGARFAGTFGDGSKLHCRFNVKIPRHDEKMETARKQ
jgi:hypothetical protein